jgi:HSP20 family molecular chaperone IbpA
VLGSINLPDHRDLSRVALEDPVGGWHPEGCCSAWSPQMDVYDYPDTIKVKIDLPGMTLDDIDVHCDPSFLRVEGRRLIEPVGLTEQGRTIERGFGRFARAYALPVAIDLADIAVALQSGVLEITLAKRLGPSVQPAHASGVTRLGPDIPVTHCEWCGAEYPVPETRSQ